MFEKFPTNRENNEEKEAEFNLPDSSAELMRMIKDGEIPKTMLGKVRGILADAEVEQRDLNNEERENLRSVLHERGITLREDEDSDPPLKKAA